MKRVSVRYLEDFGDDVFKGNIIEYSEESAKSIVDEGIAEYVEEDKKNNIVEKVIKKKEVVKEIVKKEPSELKKELFEAYEMIKSIIEEYCDIDKKYISIISLWIIGTYIHNEFESYPYLFINAMRGSGKTRLLKIIATLSYNGEVINSISESVLFRTGKGSTLCIDEFEGVNKKENNNLRELLNSAYKRGVKVKRMKKKKTSEGENYVVEEFDIYMPISMANIWGMEEVLGDRCITVLLEKTTLNYISKLIEDFNENEYIKALKDKLTKIQCSLCSLVTVKKLNTLWNQYIQEKYPNINKTTLTTYTTTTTNYINYIDFFNKIDESNINGRNLELSFPLLLIANSIDLEVFEDVLNSLNFIINEKKSEEFNESRDVIFLDFISQQTDSNNFILVKKLTKLFKEFFHADETEDNWITSKWVGRALRRLKLTIEKKRLSYGIEVRLDIEKAQKQIKIFK